MNIIHSATTISLDISSMQHYSPLIWDIYNLLGKCSQGTAQFHPADNANVAVLSKNESPGPEFKPQTSGSTCRGSTNRATNATCFEYYYTNNFNTFASDKIRLELVSYEHESKWHLHCDKVLTCTINTKVDVFKDKTGIVLKLLYEN